MQNAIFIILVLLFFFHLGVALNLKVGHIWAFTRDVVDLFYI